MILVVAGRRCFGSFCRRSLVSISEPGMGCSRTLVYSASSLSNKYVVDVNVATIGLPAKVLDSGFISLCILGRK